MLHPGSVRHGGAELTAGVRYILVCFLFDATVVDHDRRCLLRANAALSKALSANRGSEFSVALLREAVAEFDRSLLCGNAEKAESAHVGRGHALLELGETAAAVAALEAAVERAPRNAFGLSTLAAARKALGDVDGACAAGRAACDADARSAVARNNLGLLLLDGKGRPDEAMAVFAEGLEIDPDDPELLRQLRRRRRRPRRDPDGDQALRGGARGEPEPRARAAEPGRVRGDGMSWPDFPHFRPPNWHV